MPDYTPDDSSDISPHAPASPLDGMLCFSVYAASLAFNRLYKPLLEPFGLTYLQYLVLVVLREQGDLTVGGLGSACSSNQTRSRPC
jgi:hypothetical protein